MTIEELQEQTDLSHGTIQRITSDHLNLRKIITHHVPKRPTDFQRTERGFEYAKRIWPNSNQVHGEYLM